MVPTFIRALSDDVLAYGANDSEIEVRVIQMETIWSDIDTVSLKMTSIFVASIQYVLGMTVHL